ncbi:hypothetical protein HOY82DRAFT_612058 [Tuber indicum]|nr:hypothetical protein HOY82DRAFT_612058 [Tuber indicum]
MRQGDWRIKRCEKFDSMTDDSGSCRKKWPDILRMGYLPPKPIRLTNSRSLGHRIYHPENFREWALAIPLASALTFWSGMARPDDLSRVV